VVDRLGCDRLGLRFCFGDGTLEAQKKQQEDHWGCDWGTRPSRLTEPNFEVVSVLVTWLTSQTSDVSSHEWNGAAGEGHRSS